ncbi:MAG TPA: hypothetical protein VF595_05980 [Tepidisphaeraceae bacterium]|jgi:hypothetical protein
MHDVYLVRSELALVAGRLDEAAAWLRMHDLELAIVALRRKQHEPR